MSIRRKVGRFRVLVAAVLLAISTLALPATTEPAHAQQGCSPQTNIIPTWSVLYDDRGVTLCRGDGPAGAPDLRAYVHIIDLDAGAKLRLIADPLITSGGSPSWNEQYNKRLADDWFDWIKSNVPTPAPGRLFSTTNASFFIDTTSDTTAFSLPHLTTVTVPPGLSSGRWTLGWVSNPENREDPAWDAAKRSLILGNAAVTRQDVDIAPFPTHYRTIDAANALGRGPQPTPFFVVDGTVSYDPAEEPGTGFRNFVGFDGSKVYILTTTIPYSSNQAQSIIASFGSAVEIQLDGGGSAQMYYETDDGQTGEFTSIIGRAVPDVLAVYLAPE